VARSTSGAAAVPLPAGVDRPIVYGTLATRPLQRGDALRRRTRRTRASKRRGSSRARVRHTYGLPALVTNCSKQLRSVPVPGEADPADDPERARRQAAADLRRRRHVRDWLHVGITAQGFCRRSEGTFGEKYNIGGGNERTNLEIVDRICDVMEVLVPARSNRALNGVQLSTSSNGMFRSSPATTGATRSTRPRSAASSDGRRGTRFEQGLAATAQWYITHLDWCAQMQQGRYDRQRLGLG